jgi:3-deoxy-D-manno-octulosonate 8-phosphate phosphatase (KDO 8-P phosphatase)
MARCGDLGIRPELVIQGSSDKAAHLDELERILGVGDEHVAAVGDDLPDLPVLERAGFSACPSDAAPEVAAACDLVCGAAGGKGAVREVAELILKGQRRWQDTVGPWLGPTDTDGADAP